VKDLQARRVMRALPEMQRLKRVKLPVGTPVEVKLIPVMSSFDTPTGPKFYRRVA